MTVETFYFCADMAQVERWWQQPLKQTIVDISSYKVEEKAKHWGMITNMILRETLIPSLEKLVPSGQSTTSLAQICTSSIEEAASPFENRLVVIFPWEKQKIMEKRFGIIAQLGDIYTALVLTSQRGPVNEPLETRIVDQAFSNWLEAFIPSKDAQRYDASLVTDSQKKLPPEYSTLEGHLLDELEMYVPFSYEVDTKLWVKNIKRIESIPDIWDALREDLYIFSKIEVQPNLKSYNRHTPIYNKIVNNYLDELNFDIPSEAKDEFLMLGTNNHVSVERISHYFQKIFTVSQYATENSLQMLKIMYM
ncbi:MAG: hypothetical protein ACT6FF_07930 [Methanosarcinaceae archaeon]